MAQIGDIGGGSTSSVCSISPSDEKAILGNLISRVSDMEKFLSQLIGADSYSNNLSELAKDLGNVLNGTILLPSDPNSPYGTGTNLSIPANFTGTVITGSTYTLYNNGVATVQMTASGGIVTGGGGIQPVDVMNVNGWGTSGTQLFASGGTATNGSFGAAVHNESGSNPLITYGFTGDLFTGSATGNGAGRSSSSAIFTWSSTPYNSGFRMNTRVFLPAIIDERIFLGLVAGINNSYNLNDPSLSTTDWYMGFQYCSPRGDTAWQLTFNSSASYGATPSQSVASTGVSIVANQWYDMTLEVLANSGTLSWSITNLTTNVTTTGSQATPTFGSDVIDFYGGPFYKSGFVIHNANGATGAKSMYIHHFWCETLDTTTP